MEGPIAQLLPVSIKGVLIERGAVVLLMNERDEWELPGERLEEGETPEQCILREFREETGANVQVGPILTAWAYEVLPKRRVFIVAYVVGRGDGGTLVPSDEHRQLRWWPVDDLPEAALPDGYRRAIAAAGSGPTACQKVGAGRTSTKVSL